MRKLTTALVVISLVLVVTDTAMAISPDIKTNNLDGPVTVQLADNLSVIVSLDPEGSSVDCDWWVAAATPFGWYYFDVVKLWTYAGNSYTDLSTTHQGPLFNLSPFSVLDMSGLPVGTYTFYFAVDTNINGSLDLDQLFYDAVEVTINNNGKTTITVPVSSFVNNVPVKAAQPTNISFVYDLPASAGPYTDISVDLNATLKNVTVDLTNSTAAQLMGYFMDFLTEAADPSTAQVSVRIGSASDISTVCQTGFLVGTFTVFGDSSNQPSSITPSTSSAPQSSLSIVNTGAFAICAEIISPVDATISAGGVVLDATTCNETPADFSGLWIGTWSCSNIGCPNEGGSISLTVTQNGNSAHYEDDGGASYDGTVCGNVFEFNGGGAGYTESGTLVLNADGTASKTSSWREDDGSCQGDCADDLHR